MALTPESVNLTDAQFADLEARFPRSPGSGDIGKRSVAIAKLRYLASHPACTFEDNPSPGIDLSIHDEAGTLIESVEIKGTASSTIAWIQLKVSSPHSYHALTVLRLPVLRVVSIYERTPKIYRLLNGEHFELVEEPRWQFKRIGLTRR